MPSSLVCVEFFVPFSWTVAPPKGAPFSSTTLPVTGKFCAIVGKKKPRRNRSIRFFLSNFLFIMASLGLVKKKMVKFLADICRCGTGLTGNQKGGIIAPWDGIKFA